MTGTIEFKGKSTFELKLQQEPRVNVSGTDVVLTFPVFVADMPGQVAPVEIYMPLRQAEWFLAQFQVALSLAKQNSPIFPNT